MRVSSVLTISLAIIAGLGAYLLLSLGNTGAKAPQTAKSEFIVVAAKPLVFGEKLQAGHLRLVPWTDRVLPDGAFTSINRLVPPAASYRMLANLSVNEPLLQSHLTKPGQNASLSSLIDPEKKAVTVRIKDTNGVVGFLQPGDYVDVFATYNSKKSRSQAYTDLLLRKARVLTIAKQPGGRNKVAQGKSVTLEVVAKDAQKLVLAASVGQLSLVLRNGEGPLDTSTGRVDMGDLQMNRRRRSQGAGDKPVVVVRRQGGFKEYNVMPDVDEMSDSKILRVQINAEPRHQEIQ